MTKKYSLLTCSAVTALLLFVISVAPVSQCKAQTYVLSTVAGGCKGDGTPARPSILWDSNWLFPDGAGSVLYSETLGHRVRSLDPVTMLVSDFAGNGESGPPTSSGPALQGSFYYPGGIARDADGNTYIADTYHQMIHKVDSSGVMTRIVGTGILTGMIDGPGGDPRDDSGDGGPALNCTLAFPHTLACDPVKKYLYIAEDTTYQDHNAQTTDPIFSLGNRIRRIDLQTGVITTFAGTGFYTGSIDGQGGPDARDDLGDNGPATNCTFARVLGLAMAQNGDLHAADSGNHRVRKIDSTGNIRTVAGNGIGTGSIDGEGGVAVDDLGDGKQALQATLHSPAAVAFDNQWRLLISDNGNSRIRMVSASGTMSTIAGTGDPQHQGFSGDGGPAISAELDYPWGVACDVAGNVFFCDVGNNRIRMIDTGNIIHTIAGNTDYIGENVAATEAFFASPYYLSYSASGDLYIADMGHHVVRKVEAATGNIKTIAGNGTISWDIDGQGGDPADDIADNVQATSTSLCFPVDAEADSQGNVYIAEYYSQRVRKVDPTGVITTVAGPDSARCVSLANIYFPPPANRWYYYAFIFSGRLDRDPSGGAYTDDNWGNGGAATSATLAFPSDVAIAANGDLYISDGGLTINWGSPGPLDMGGCMVRRVDHTTNVITTVVGTGVCTNSVDGPGGDPTDDLNDGMPATQASLRFNRGITFDPAGNLYISDTGNSRVRMVDAVNWNINTVVGTGYSTGSIDGYSSGDPLDDLYDAGPATSVSVKNVRGIALDPDGNIYIADSGNNRVRQLSSGYIKTVAGDGTDQFWDGFYGDGQPSSSVSMLREPYGTAWNPAVGAICFTDSGNGRVRCAKDTSVQGPKLHISQTFVDTNGPPLLPADTVTSIIVVNNTGPNGATNVVVTATPDAASLENIQAQDGGIVAGSTISWNIGSMNGGASATVHYTGKVRCTLASGVEIADGTQICSNNYMVTSTETGDIPGSPILCLTVSRPVLTITKEILAPPVDKIHAGDTVDYRITVCNTGSTPGTNLSVFDTMEVPYVVTPPAAIGQGGIWNGGAGRIEWTIPQLSPQPPCQELTCSVQVSTSAADHQSICDSATVEAEDLYTSCAWQQPGQPIAQYRACFEVAPADSPNHLLKSCCSSAENPCDRGAKFPLAIDRQILQSPATEIETGLTDTSQPLCFYQTERPSPGNSLKVIKNTATPADPDDMAISF